MDYKVYIDGNKLISQDDSHIYIELTDSERTFRIDNSEYERLYDKYHDDNVAFVDFWVLLKAFHYDKNLFVEIAN